MPTTTTDRDVGEELVAQTFALMRALDKTSDIRDGKYRRDSAFHNLDEVLTYTQHHSSTGNKRTWTDKTRTSHSGLTVQLIVPSIGYPTSCFSHL